MAIRLAGQYCSAPCHTYMWCSGAACSHEQITLQTAQPTKTQQATTAKRMMIQRMRAQTCMYRGRFVSNKLQYKARVQRIVP
eukprot:16247-Heterococcus_DN1.PRE.7